MSSGVPFNPMKKVPPPPPPADKSGKEAKDYIRLVASDGHVIVIDKECARVSRRIRAFLADQGPVERCDDVKFDGSDPSRIVLTFEHTPAALLEKAAQYLYYKYRYESDAEHRPAFDVPFEMALELLKVATLLQC